jgi:hypothetical protein
VPSEPAAPPRGIRLAGPAAPPSGIRLASELEPAAAILAEASLLPVLPALRDLLPGGGLQRGSVVAAERWGMLCLALAAGPTSAGAWCAVAGLPQLGISAAADVGVDIRRLLLIPELGTNWHQVIMSLLDGCDLVLFRPPDRPPAQVRRKIEAAVRRFGAVLVVAGEWDGAQVRLRVASQEWTGIGAGHGRLRARRSQVVAEGRGGWSRQRARWLWLPGPDGSVTEVTGIAGIAGAADAAEADAAASVSLPRMRTG